MKEDTISMVKQERDAIGRALSKQVADNDHLQSENATLRAQLAGKWVLGEPLTNIWDEVARLVEVNALHRSGLRLQDATPNIVLKHAGDELGELCSTPDEPGELADLIGVLFHYAILKGWTADEIMNHALDKFAKRFTLPQPEVPAVPPLMERIAIARCSSCQCNVKSPEWSKHDPQCRYRVLCEAEELLAALNESGVME